MNESEDAEQRFSFQSRMLLMLANNFYKTNHLLLAYHQSLRAVHDRPEDLIVRREIFVVELNELINEVSKSIEYCKILVRLDSDEIDALIDKQPNGHTLHFLRDVHAVAPRSMQDDLRGKIDDLSEKIFGYQSGRWTGRTSS